MAKQLSFETKVQGLLDYHQTLLDIDPEHEGRVEAANPQLFYTARRVSRSLSDARLAVRTNLALHAHVEYGLRGYGRTDLHADTAARRADRADVLAVVSGPVTSEERAARAERIAGVLGAFSEGGLLSVANYSSDSREAMVPARKFEIDPSRALFGVFRNTQVSSNILTLQYDRPDVVAFFDGEVGEPIVDLSVPHMATNDGLVVKPQLAR